MPAPHERHDEPFNVTYKPASGIESIDVKTGTDKCWGVKGGPTL